MKKVLLSLAAVFAFGFANAQSNQKGTIHINVLGGLLSGTASDKSDESGSETIKYKATGGQFGVNFQYGLAESFSAGIGLEFGTSVMTFKDATMASDAAMYGYTAPSMSTFKVNLSGRYYFVNDEKFNVFAGPSIGMTTGKDTGSAVFGGLTTSTKYSGLNYGINAGGNYYFSDHVGVILNLGYEGNGLKSTMTEAGVADVTGKSTLGGIKVMAGLALKF